MCYLPLLPAPAALLPVPVPVPAPAPPFRAPIHCLVDPLYGQDPAAFAAAALPAAAFASLISCLILELFCT